MSDFTKKFMIAMPCEINGSVCVHMNGWTASLNTLFDGDDVIFHSGQGDDVAHSRNLIVHMFLRSDADVLWFVDSDMDPRGQSDGGVRLMREAIERDDVDICSGISFRVSGRPDGPVPCVSSTKGREHVIDEVFKAEAGLLQSEGLTTGGACIAIKRHVFENFLEQKEIWFKTHLEEEDPRKWGLLKRSEDIHFIRTAEELGHKFFIDTRIVWGHIKPTDLREEIERTRLLLEKQSAPQPQAEKPLLEVAR